MGLEDVVANSLTGLSFSGFTLFAVLLIAAAVWCVVPFVLYATLKRLTAVERVVEENISTISNDMRRINDVLLMQRMIRDRDDAPALPVAEATPEPEPAPEIKLEFGPETIFPQVIDGGAEPRRANAG